MYHVYAGSVLQWADNLCCLQKNTQNPDIESIPVNFAAEKMKDDIARLKLQIKRLKKGDSESSRPVTASSQPIPASSRPATASSRPATASSMVTPKSAVLRRVYCPKTKKFVRSESSSSINGFPSFWDQDF